MEDRTRMNALTSVGFLALVLPLGAGCSPVREAVQTARTVANVTNCIADAVDAGDALAHGKRVGQGSAGSTCKVTPNDAAPRRTASEPDTAPDLATASPRPAATSFDAPTVVATIRSHKLTSLLWVSDAAEPAYLLDITSDRAHWYQGRASGGTLKMRTPTEHPPAAWLERFDRHTNAIVVVEAPETRSVFCLGSTPDLLRLRTASPSERLTTEQRSKLLEILRDKPGAPSAGRCVGSNAALASALVKDSL
jgi:hypothetical protein